MGLIMPRPVHAYTHTYANIHHFWSYIMATCRLMRMPIYPARAHRQGLQEYIIKMRIGLQMRMLWGHDHAKTQTCLYHTYAYIHHSCPYIIGICRLMRMTMIYL